MSERSLFRCYLCRRMVDDRVPHNEALEEYKRKFPGAPEWTKQKVCEDCYRQFIKTWRPTGEPK